METERNIYDEFDDCEWIGSYCQSKEARDQMIRLKAQHGLDFLFNQGGGQFTGPSFNCQISTLDDVQDLNVLRRALQRRP